MKPEKIVSVRFKINAIEMFKNYLIIAFRNLTRQKTYSIINLSGLAIGFACSLLILIHVYTELSYDDHFKDAEDIHRLAVKASLSGNEFEAAVTGGPLAHILKSELPEISGYTRLREGTMTLLSVGEKYFYEENILFADSSFFEIFSFEFITRRIFCCIDASLFYRANRKNGKKNFWKLSIRSVKKLNGTMTSITPLPEFLKTRIKKHILILTSLFPFQPCIKMNGSVIYFNHFLPIQH